MQRRRVLRQPRGARISSTIRTYFVIHVPAFRYPCVRGTRLLVGLRAVPHDDGVALEPVLLPLQQRRVPGTGRDSTLRSTCCKMRQN
eukprot:6184414-Pleurochrysis_carterae.AAC.5